VSVFDAPFPLPSPTGLSALHRPIRYVLEFTYSLYFGDQEDVLGFNHLFSIGAGLELDTSHYICSVSQSAERLTNATTD